MSEYVGQIILSQINNEEYYLKTNHEEVLIYTDSVGEKTANNLEIQLYKMPYSAGQRALDFLEKCELIFEKDTKTINLMEAIIKVQSDGDESTWLESFPYSYENNKLTYDFTSLLTYSKLEENIPESGGIIRFSYYMDSGKTKMIFTKIFGYQDALSTQLANFQITAGSITALIEEKKMSFSSDGLAIYNTGFSIYKDIKDSTNNSLIFSVDDGELYLKGNIDAISGTIGGFQIDENKLTSTGLVYKKTEDAQYNDKKNYYYINESGQYELVILSDETKPNPSEQGYYEVERSAIELDGRTGTVFINNLKLGKEATISEYIQLGETYLLNPSTKHPILNKYGYVLTSGGLQLKNDGTINLSQNSSITGKNWSITEDKATFRNIIAEGSIKTAVFEAETTQAVGGAMIFLPSYKIKRINSNRVYFEEEIIYETATDSESTQPPASPFADQGMVWIVSGNTYKEFKIMGQDPKNNSITLNEEPNFNEDDPLSLIYIGLTQEDNENILPPLIIAMNSGHSKVADGYVYGQGLTLTEYHKNSVPSRPNLFLGNLKNLNLEREEYVKLNPDDWSYFNEIYEKSGDQYILTEDKKYDDTKQYYILTSFLEDYYQGYGLYADNVFLNGSLTTKSDQGSYAGVNTISKIGATKFVKYFATQDENPISGKDYYTLSNNKYTLVEFDSNSSFVQGTTYYERTDGDTSKIIFWGGASAVDDESITEAKFQVTEEGSVYASNAWLENSLFVGSEIRSSKIYSAELYGIGNENNISKPALTIYDTNQEQGDGIVFKDLARTDTYTFKISSSGLFARGKQFLTITNDDKIVFNINEISTQTVTNGCLSLTSINVGSKEEERLVPVLLHKVDDDTSCGYYFDLNKTSFKMGEQEKMTWEESKTTICTDVVFSKQLPGGTIITMNQVAVDGGYNLFCG